MLKFTLYFQTDKVTLNMGVGFGWVGFSYSLTPKESHLSMGLVKLFSKFEKR